MNKSLMEKNLSEDNYNEYIESIANIFRLSSKESSILFDLKIKDYKAMIKLSIVSQNGEQKEFQDVVFKCDSIFYNDFLKSLIEMVNDNSNIVVKDIINLSDSDLMTLRLITDNNDMFSIDGLSDDDAKSLLLLIDGQETDSGLLISDNKGMGNYFSFLLIISFLIFGLMIFIFVLK